jgi:cytoskeletal protein CcmA (bactofilin family)
MLEFLKGLISRLKKQEINPSFSISSGFKVEGLIMAPKCTGRINGNFKGDFIECKSLVIGKDAKISGSVFAEELHIHGTCVGNIFASTHVKIYGKSRITGNICSPLITIVENAYLNGKLSRVSNEEFDEALLREKLDMIQRKDGFLSGDDGHRQISSDVTYDFEKLMLNKSTGIFELKSNKIKPIIPEIRHDLQRHQQSLTNQDLEELAEPQKNAVAEENRRWF